MYEYITFTKSELTKEIFNPIVNREFFCKPDGGLWACTYTPNHEFVSAWQEWCFTNSFRYEKLKSAVVFNVRKDARIYIINTYSDFERLLEKYLYRSPLNDMVISSILNMKFIDYEKMSKDYDGIYLTAKGEWETRYRYDANLYGWDVASLLLFNFDVITDTKYIAFERKEVSNG